MKLLIATGNQGKLREFTGLLAGLPFELGSLADFPSAIEVAETGAGFAENAELKAAGYARQTETWTLADDSGLEVEALGGAPGVFSARYAGVGATDAENVDKLLRELAKTNDSRRRARFVCAISLADRRGEIVRTETGVCDGAIVFKPLGDNGFGYDPVFLPDGFKETFGELADEAKLKISHRARAATEIMRFLRDFGEFSLDREPFPR